MLDNIRWENFLCNLISDKRSTITAIRSDTNYIIRATDKRKCCAALFVNLTKAFDTVNHAMLLQDIDIGFNFISPKRYQDYLSYRQQCVTLGSNCSAFLPSAYTFSQFQCLYLEITWQVHDHSKSQEYCSLHTIERASVYRYLDIWLDQKLTFKFHTDTLASKSKQKLDNYTETKQASLSLYWTQFFTWHSDLFQVPVIAVIYSVW